MEGDRVSEPIPLEYEALPDAPEEWVRRVCAWEAPRLPGLRRGNPRRWKGAATWQPADTILLCRHRSDDGSRTIVTRDRRSPPGFTLEYDLGAIHAHRLPFTQRLLATADDSWTATAFDGDPAPGVEHLGWVEQAPLPMLDPLFLARDPATGAPVLVCGADDPLHEQAEPIRLLGWVESFPVHPRQLDEIRPPASGFVVLRRTVDRDGWRHRYRADPTGADQPDGVAIGGIWDAERDSAVALRSREDGRIVSDLLPEGPAHGQVSDAVRWALAPLTWSEGAAPKAWGARATLTRGRRYVRGFGAPATEPAVLGYARRDPGRGWEPLYSGTHPVTGDQLLSPSARELGDLGYTVDGVIGHAVAAFADGSERLRADEVPWGSRFGHGRRI